MAYLTDLADVLRRAGLNVVEIAGWQTRGRPGTFEPIGVLCHHTGGTGDGLAYAKWMALEGRSDLNPPLAQLGLDRKGTYYVQAAGRANHAGQCKPIAGLQPYAGRTYGDGNAQLIGIEAMNTGSEGWPRAQYDAYVRGCAALNAAYGWPVKRTLAHRETSLAGKPDPGGIDMTIFRGDVAAVTPTPPPTGDDDMPTPEEFWQHRFTLPDGSNSAAAATHLAHARQQAYRANAHAQKAATDVAALSAVFAQLVAAQPGQTLTAQEIADAAKAGASAALDERITDADVVLTVGDKENPA